MNIGVVSEELATRLRLLDPKSQLGKMLGLVAFYIPIGDVLDEVLDTLLRSVIVESTLSVLHIHGPNGLRPYARDDYGIVSRKVVTTAGANRIAACFVNSSTSALDVFKYHGLGTGTNAEAIGDTALQTELTTQYSTDNTRATGTNTNPSGNVAQSVATNTVDASAAVTEHGIFTQGNPLAGTLLDRSVFSVVNLANGDSLQSTYQLTINAGG